jgi:hypothetical protein
MAELLTWAAILAVAVVCSLSLVALWEVIFHGDA